MKNVITALLFLVVVFSIKAYSVDLTEEQIQVKADEYYKKYKFEWDHILSDESKTNIQQSYYKGSVNNRAYAAAISDFLESRGGMAKYMVNIYITKSYVNKKGKTIKGKVSMDCGRYGINTRTFAHYNNIIHTTERALDICYSLKHDNNLAYEHFDKTMDIAEKRYAKKGYTGREYFRKTMNYYNSGKDQYTGEHYIKSIALVKLFREVL